MYEVSKFSAKLHNPLKVKFIDEEAEDEGIVRYHRWRQRHRPHDRQAEGEAAGRRHRRREPAEQGIPVHDHASP